MGIYAFFNNPMYELVWYLNLRNHKIRFLYDVYDTYESNSTETCFKMATTSESIYFNLEN